MLVNMHDAKTNLSHYLALAEQGEEVILCRRNVPVAQLKPLNYAADQRPIGGYKKPITIPDTFFEPLPDEALSDFENPQ